MLVKEDPWAFRERMAVKAAEQRRFLELGRSARASQVNPKKVKSAAPPKREPMIREPKAPRTPAPPKRKRAPRIASCSACGVAFKRPGEDAPGAKRHIRDGLCRPCISVREGRTARRPRPERCRRCDRPVRPAEARVADWPGTVQYRGNGVCATCADHVNGTTKPKPRRPERCEQCDRPLFSNTPAGLANRKPGEVQYGGKGCCSTCFKKVYYSTNPQEV